MEKSFLVLEFNTTDLRILKSSFRDFILSRSPSQVSSIEGVETDTYGLVSVYGRRSSGGN